MIKNQNRKSQKRIKTNNLQKNSHFNKKKKKICIKIILKVSESEFKFKKVNEKEKRHNRAYMKPLTSHKKSFHAGNNRLNERGSPPSKIIN